MLAAANAMLEAYGGSMRRAVVEPALAGRPPVVSRIADCRYVGQGHEIQRRAAAAAPV